MARARGANKNENRLCAYNASMHLERSPGTSDYHRKFKCYALLCYAMPCHVCYECCDICYVFLHHKHEVGRGGGGGQDEGAESVERKQEPHLGSGEQFDDKIKLVFFCSFSDPRLLLGSLF